jgi:hypothetical protein
VLALAVAAGVLSPGPDPPAARAAHNPAAPFSGALWITTDADPRPATFSLTVADVSSAEFRFAAMGAIPGAIPYPGCNPGPGASPVYYVGTYITAAGDTGRIGGCQESAGGGFLGWYRSDTQSTPNQAWGITLQIGGPSGGPGTWAQPGELLPGRRLSWQEAPSGTPALPAPSAPIGAGCGAGVAFEAGAAGLGVRAREAQAPARTFCGVRPLRDDVRAGVEGNAEAAGGASFVACVAALVAAAGAGITVPATGGGTAPLVGPTVVNVVAAACGTSLLTWAGFSLRGQVDDVVRSQTGTPPFEHALPRPRRATAKAEPIVLPRPRLTRGAGAARRCGTGRGRTACLRIAGLGARAVSASADAASLGEAMAVSAARGLRAAGAGDAEGAAVQEAVSNAYAGALAQALATQRRAAAAFARAVRAQGLDLRPSRRQVVAVKGRLSRLQGVPRLVISRLRRDGFGDARIRATFSGLGAVPARPLSLARALAPRAPTAGLVAAWESIDIPQAAAVVRALSAQGGLSATLAAALLAGLERLRTAGAADRPAAADRLAADAARARGRHGLLLQLLIEPLVSVDGA